LLVAAVALQMRMLPELVVGVQVDIELRLELQGAGLLLKIP
jgi:hypothetical protein